MQVTKGAGQRLMADFQAGAMHYNASSASFDSISGQNYFVTNKGHVVRFDLESKQHNVYNPRLDEFVPCEGMVEGEYAVDHGTPELLFRKLLAEKTWGRSLL